MKLNFVDKPKKKIVVKNETNDRSLFLLVLIVTYMLTKELAKVFALSTAFAIKFNISAAELVALQNIK